MVESKIYNSSDMVEKQKQTYNVLGIVEGKSSPTMVEKKRKKSHQVVIGYLLFPPCFSCIQYAM